MSKIGRNDPCPCGSGKKYKQCCLAKDEEAHRAERETHNAELAAQVLASRAAVGEQLDRSRESEAAAEAVWSLIEACRFTEAESAALEYIERFPETPGGYDLMSLLCEARGEPLAAAQWCRKVIEFMRAHPAIFTSKDEVQFRRRIQRLDPASSSG
jgi:SEC-C motif